MCLTGYTGKGYDQHRFLPTVLVTWKVRVSGTAARDLRADTRLRLRLHTMFQPIIVLNVLIACMYTAQCVCTCALLRLRTPAELSLLVIKIKK